MEKINNFFLDKKKGGHKNCLSLKIFIEKFVEEETSSVLDNLSTILQIPVNILKDKSKQIVSNQFNFKSGKFNLNFSIVRVFFDYLIFLFLIFSQLINRRAQKNKDRKNIDFMLDGISHTDEIYRFKNIINNYDKSLIVLKKKINYDQKKFKKSTIIFKRRFFKSSGLLSGKLKNFFIFGFKVYKISLDKKFNFFKLINIILNSAMNYNYLFENYNVKFLLHDRFFTTCPIRNYFLKQKCNGMSASIQVHLAESSISLFVFSDIIFTLGCEEDTKNKLISLGGKIKLTQGVGSLKMEHLLDSKIAKDHKKYFSDILIIGVNITDWFYTSEITSEAYYKFLKLIKEMSLMFPNKKIIYKHHGNFKWSNLEKKILHKSNVKIIIDKKEIRNKNEYIFKVILKRILSFFYLKSKSDTKYNSLFYGSYYYLLNSKFIISFGSTMILEAIGKNKNAFFINPDAVENPYTEKLNYLDKCIINDPKNLSDKILREEKNKLIETDKEKICVEGNSSNLICNFINNIIKNY